MINWKVRFKNPLWGVNIAAAIMLPVLTNYGMNWSQMTSWEALGGAFQGALGNPVVLVAIIVAVWNTIHDPTTAGLGDSRRALKYDAPFKDQKEKIL